MLPAKHSSPDGRKKEPATHSRWFLEPRLLPGPLRTSSQNPPSMRWYISSSNPSLPRESGCATHALEEHPRLLPQVPSAPPRLPLLRAKALRNRCGLRPWLPAADLDSQDIA